jgi:hypothetical protein
MYDPVLSNLIAVNISWLVTFLASLSPTPFMYTQLQLFYMPFGLIFDFPTDCSGKYDDGSGEFLLGSFSILSFIFYNSLNLL